MERKIVSPLLVVSGIRSSNFRTPPDVLREVVQGIMHLPFHHQLTEGAGDSLITHLHGCFAKMFL